MKKFYIYKLIQLGFFFLYIFVVAHFVLKMNGWNSFEAAWMPVGTVYILILVTAAIFFVCVLIDLLFLKKIHYEQQGIDKITYLDPVTGGLNRYSCDLMLKNYDTKEIKPNIGCVIFTIDNLVETNEQYGYNEGNVLIRNFNDLLVKAVGNKGVAARNAPNRFLVVFKKCDADDMDAYLKEVGEYVSEYNLDKTKKFMKYHYGTALNCEEGKSDIPEMIALAHRRLTQSE